MTAYLVTTTTTSTACPDVTSGHAFKNANQILLKQKYYETYY